MTGKAKSKLSSQLPLLETNPEPQELGSLRQGALESGFKATLCSETGEAGEAHGSEGETEFQRYDIFQVEQSDIKGPTTH